MSYDGRQVANFVLDLCEAEGREVTNLSLQKIVFFCHAWSLAELKRPLVKHQFEAWQYGPVLQYLYRDFKSFESGAITSRAKKLDPVNGVGREVDYSFDADVEILIRKVVQFYSSLTAGALVELSHVEGGPWHGIWNHEGKINPGMRIEDAAISDYYSRVRAPY
jgi:uncharacterized phage-associated protein